MILHLVLPAKYPSVVRSEAKRSKKNNSGFAWKPWRVSSWSSKYCELVCTKGQEVVSTKGKVEEWNKTYKTLNQPIDTEIRWWFWSVKEVLQHQKLLPVRCRIMTALYLIGKRTFGKGLVQTTRPLAYNSQLKVTTAKYYIPSGRCIQALDYTHRKEDGSVERIADSLKTRIQD